eukprot:1154524-Pelagomonas_calceolata.AAC.7
MLTVPDWRTWACTDGGCHIKYGKQELEQTRIGANKNWSKQELEQLLLPSGTLRRLIHTLLQTVSPLFI